MTPFLGKVDFKKSAYFLPVAIFLAMLPVTMIVPVFKEIVKDRFQSGNEEVAWFLSIAMLGSFVFSPVAGFLSDSFGTRKKIIILFCGFDALLLNLLPYADTLFTLLFLRFLEGGAHVFVIGLLLASVADFEHGNSKSKFGNGVLMGLSGMLLSFGGAVGLSFGFLGKIESNFTVSIWFNNFIVSWLDCISICSRRKAQSFRKTFLEKIFDSIFNTPSSFVSSCIPIFRSFYIRIFYEFAQSTPSRRIFTQPFRNRKDVILSFLPMALLSYPAIRLSQKTGKYFPVAIGSLIYGVSLTLSGLFQSVIWIEISLLFCGLGAGLMFATSLRLASSLCNRENNGIVMASLTGFGSLGFFLGPISSVGLDRISTTWTPFIGASPTAFVFGTAQILIVLISIPFYKILNQK